MSLELELNWVVVVRMIWVLPTSIVLRLGSKSEETSELISSLNNDDYEIDYEIVKIKFVKFKFKIF